MSAGSGRHLQGLFAWYDRATCSWRTSQACCLPTTQWPKFLGTWPTSGTMRNGLCYAHQTSGPATDAPGCSSWPTLQSQDAAAGSPERVGRYGTKHGGRNLTDDVTIWQTPGTDSFRSRGGDRRDEIGLDRQARTWPTPRTITGGPESSKRKKELGRRESGGGDLQAMAHEMMTFHASPRDPQTPGGPICWCGARNCDQRSHKRRLNPLFVEFLMGLPLGWTADGPLDCAPSAMPSSRRAPSGSGK
jgi:hypothetical protein